MQRKAIFGALIAASLLTAGASVQAQNPRGDLDRDGIQNRYDRDRDGDGIRNRNDPNPRSANVARYNPRGPNGDLDRDGIKNRYDKDRDGDGVNNRRDRFPDNPRRR
ncbi:MAG: hypothetical protein JWP22_442 [Ramlibacter sp.]|jgi:hypothetical protein|nr:hypothetical protein [Ramlibacter sp.]